MGKKKCKKEKVGKCKNCKHWQVKRFCTSQGGPTLFVALLNRYISIGFTKEEASERSYLLPETPKGHSCKHWEKSNK